MTLMMIGDLITNGKPTMKNMRVREIEDKWFVVIVNNEGRIIATYKDGGHDTAQEAQRKLDEEYRRAE